MSVKTDITQKLDLEIKRNDTFDLDIEVFDADGNPYVFTTETAKMEIRDVPGGTIYLTLTTGSGITLSDGVISLLAADTDTDLDPDISYVHDIQITLPDGKVKTWFGGDVTVNDDVTRS